MPLIRRENGPPDGTPVTAEVEALLAELHRSNPDARWAAARRLSAHPGSAPALGMALADEANAHIREAIFTSLGRIGAEAVEVLLPYLRSDDAAMRCGAIDALQLTPQAVRPHMATLLHDADADVRLLATEFARPLAPADATGLLVAVLDHDPEPNVCAAAVEVLSESGTREALEPLRRCAARFPDAPFLAFAIETAVARISGGH